MSSDQPQGIKGYTVKYEDRFEKWVQKNLPQQIKKALDKKLEYFSNNPNYPSLNTKPYTGVSQQTLKRLEADAIYEFRINMSYRCLIYVSHTKKELVLAYVGDHDEVRNFIRNC